MPKLLPIVLLQLLQPLHITYSSVATPFALLSLIVIASSSLIGSFIVTCLALLIFFVPDSLAPTASLLERRCEPVPPPKPGVHLSSVFLFQCRKGSKFSVACILLLSRNLHSSGARQYITTVGEVQAMAADAEPNVIEVAEEIEGDQILSSDYYFDMIGDDVPLKLEESPFNLDEPPVQPLAVSENLGLIFTAHSSGFFVARTKDIIKAAKENKEKGSGASIEGQSVLNVHIGRVNILALSTDSTALAATVGGDVHFFSVESLLAMSEKPFYSCSLETSSVKDMRWTKSMKNSFVILSKNGTLYSGDLQKPLESVMENVDAVEWSRKGKYIVIAKKNVLSILSSKLKERLHISLPYKSWMDEISGGSVVKVDSLRWVRSDCIVVGCLQQTADKEENYHVQVVMIKDGSFAKVSSKPVVLKFSDMFQCIVDDIIPFGFGPHLLMSYLDRCDFAIAANRKNTDQHIVLLTWSEEDHDVALIDIGREKWLPRIGLQENGDDNLVLSLCTDQASPFETVKVMVGFDDWRELSPLCILMCLTLEGKLRMYHVASTAASTSLPHAASVTSDEEEKASCVETLDLPTTEVEENKSKQYFSDVDSAEADRNNISTSRVGQILLDENLKQYDSHESLIPTNSNQILGEEKADGNYGEKHLVFIQRNLNAEGSGHEAQKIDEEEKSSIGGRISGTGEILLDGTLKQYDSHESLIPTNSNQILGGEKAGQLVRRNLNAEGSGHEAQKIDEKEKWSIGRKISGTDYIQGNTVSNRSNMSNNKNNEILFKMGSEMLGNNVSGSSQHASHHLASMAQQSDARSPFSSPSVTGGIFGMARSQLSPYASPSNMALSTGHKTSTLAVTNKRNTSSNSLDVPSQDCIALSKSVSYVSYPTKADQKKSFPSNVEQNISKQHGNINDMVKEMDKLLHYIEDDGGFKDTCVRAQKLSLEALEEGIRAVHDKNVVWQNLMNQRIGEIQLLLDKTVQASLWDLLQVSLREQQRAHALLSMGLEEKTYIEGIVKQTTDSQYWDFWNRQKLSSELELKRKNIFDLNQELINQLIGLEKHFNALELHKFGESNRESVHRPSLQSKCFPSRQLHSLHAVRNAVTSQLVAAEKLSDCLSKQLGVLNINSPSSKQENVKKQLFDSIGISYGEEFVCSPDGGATQTPSMKKPLFSSCFSATKIECRRNQLSATNIHEPETARRRRDSLDRNWASFEPPRTTIKRMPTQNERQVISSSSLSIDKRLMSDSNPDWSMVADDKGHAGQDTLLNDAKVLQDTPKKHPSGSVPTFISTCMKEPSVPSQSGVLPSAEMQILRTNNVEALSPHPIFRSSNMALNVRKETHQQRDDIVDSLKSHHVESESVPPKREKSVPQSETHSSQSQAIFPGEPRLLFPSLQGSGAKAISPAKETMKLKPAVDVSRQSAPGSLVLGSGNAHEAISSLKSSVANQGPATSSLSTPTSTTVASAALTSTSLTSPWPPLSSPVTSSSLHPLTAQIMAAKPSMEGPEPSNLPPLNAEGASSQGKSLAFTAVSPPEVKSSLSEPSTKANNLPEVSSTHLTAQVSGSNPQPTTDKFIAETPQKPDPSTPSSSVFAPSIEVPTGHSAGTAASVSSTTTLSSDASSNSNSVKQPTAFPLFSAQSSNISGGTVDAAPIQEDDMEEEATEAGQTADISLGGLDGLGPGIGSAPNFMGSRPNPFGTLASSTALSSSSSSMAVPNGDLFRPASFSFQSLQPPQQSQPSKVGSFSVGFSPATQPSTGNGFGQPAQLGGQKALGSVLGSFGQSRQLNTGFPGSGFGGGLQGTQAAGGFLNAATGSGFGGASATISGFPGVGGAGSGGFAGFGATSGGFAGLGSTSGGFAGLGSTSGGFAGAAAPAGGFGGGGAAPAIAGTGGFAAAATAGVGGFGGASSGAGGFGAFNSQGSGGFSAFGSSVGGGRQPQSELFTQMRK